VHNCELKFLEQQFETIWGVRFGKKPLDVIEAGFEFENGLQNWNWLLLLELGFVLEAVAGEHVVVVVVVELG
jgi:hypothetical protein